MMIRKVCFTLLEFLIVLFLISLGVILTGVKIKELYQEQRFLSDTQQVLSHLAMAQDLMLIMDTDVYVRIAPNQEKKGLNLWLEIEKPMDEAWGGLMARKLSLTAIHCVSFEATSGKELTLQFSLGRMSKGTLLLFEGEQDKKNPSGKKAFQIELLGYPSPIGAKEKISKKERRSEKSERLYPVDLYEE